eukprot:gnl/MRDRNA2_/MRDRNA2_177229_c0_seq1.p1 gnl/MRDRNA2_/MRDRNA2_177229_c0~~gnl/MRDRNA2_/MRDRNA2_177229_c0_seq1.p1  ORF type:complete len:856 (+),score=154.56 gnl/MRDRNA2_/MRDRNA2_177229_c0_seq1:202-2568(+)
MSSMYPGLRSFHSSSIVTARLVENADSDINPMFSQDTFSIKGPDGKIDKWEWWTPGRCDNQNLIWQGTRQLSLDSMGYEPVPTPITSEELEELLRKHCVDSASWGDITPKTVEDLFVELWRGECSFMKKDSKIDMSLARILDVVCIRIVSPKGQVLVEIRDAQKAMLPGGKKRKEEDIWAAARRVLLTKLQLSESSVDFKKDAMQRRDLEMESPSYPGLRCFYRAYIIEGEIQINQAILSRCAMMDADGAFETSRGGKSRHTTGTHKWEWWDLQRAREEEVYLDGAWLFSFDGLQKVTVPWSPSCLTDLMTLHGLEPAKFGADSTKTLTQIARELLRGEFYFVEDHLGSLVRVVDIVALLLQNSSGKAVFETQRRMQNGGTRTMKQLPGAKRRPEEGIWDTFYRVLNKVLQIPEANITIPRDAVGVLDEDMLAPLYTGIRSLYRKHVIHADVNTRDEAMLRQLGLYSSQSDMVAEEKTWHSEFGEAVKKSYSTATLAAKDMATSVKKTYSMKKTKSLGNLEKLSTKGLGWLRSSRTGDDAGLRKLSNSPTPSAGSSGRKNLAVDQGGISPTSSSSNLKKPGSSAKKLTVSIEGGSKDPVVLPVVPSHATSISPGEPPLEVTVPANQSEQKQDPDKSDTLPSVPIKETTNESTSLSVSSSAAPQAKHLPSVGTWLQRRPCTVKVAKQHQPQRLEEMPSRPQEYLQDDPKTTLHSSNEAATAKGCSAPNGKAFDKISSRSVGAWLAGSPLPKDPMLPNSKSNVQVEVDDILGMGPVPALLHETTSRNTLL